MAFAIAKSVRRRWRCYGGVDGFETIATVSACSCVVETVREPCSANLNATMEPNSNRTVSTTILWRNYPTKHSIPPRNSSTPQRAAFFGSAAPQAFFGSPITHPDASLFFPAFLHVCLPEVISLVQPRRRLSSAPTTFRNGRRAQGMSRLAALCGHRRLGLYMTEHAGRLVVLG